MAENTTNILDVNINEKDYSVLVDKLANDISTSKKYIIFPRFNKNIYIKNIKIGREINFYEIEDEKLDFDKKDQTFIFLKSLDVDRFDIKNKNSYSVSELREICKFLNLPISGKKKILIDKIMRKMEEYKLI